MEARYDDYITYLIDARPYIIWGVRRWLCHRRIGGDPWRDPRLPLMALLLYPSWGNYI